MIMIIINAVVVDGGINISILISVVIDVFIS